MLYIINKLPWTDLVAGIIFSLCDVFFVQSLIIVLLWKSSLTPLNLVLLLSSVFVVWWLPHTSTLLDETPILFLRFNFFLCRLIYVQFPMSFVFPWSLIMRNWYFLFPFLHLLWESVVTCNAEKMFLLLNYYLRVSICLFFYVTFRIGCVKSLSVSE